jgi:hypothetical protein
MAAPLRVANCSGFYGDRLAAAREMVEGGPIDVLTGDWLAELTMLILAKDLAKNPAGGFAKTFVRQVEDVLGTCLERGIKIVSNAGGLNPRGCAAAVEEVANRLGLAPRIACISGDDLMPRLDQLRAAGHDLRNMDTGAALDGRPVLTANAYLGGWGITSALERGADVVITGRVTDAALMVGPAAWHHGWGRQDWDALAGAVVAGHVIECGCQATGGNYAFFRDVPNLLHPGFPIAEIAADGSSVITKHQVHGGGVSVGTVTAQLLYEITGERYLNPDVTARFDSISLEQVGSDRVAISGVRGEPPPSTTKVCINLAGAAKVSLTFPLVGLDVEEKAELLVEALFHAIPGGRESFLDSHIDLVRSDQQDPSRNEVAAALLRITLKDNDPNRLGKPLMAAVTELGLASYPGFFTVPSAVQSYGVYWPTLVPSAALSQDVSIGGELLTVALTAADAAAPTVHVEHRPLPDVPAGPTRRAPLGRLVGARSGDKGGNANVGVWARSDDAYAWLRDFLSVEVLRHLMPEAKDLDISRYEFPRLRSLNFVLHRLLGEGVASSVRMDPQAKSLGEYLRAKHVEVPVALLDDLS